MVRVDLLSIAGWISGTLHVPLRSSMVATLNRRAEFLPLTDATPAPGEPPLAFVALRRSAIMLVLPGPLELERPAIVQPGSHEQLHLRCHLHALTVDGTIEALASLRISDYLETNRGFIALSNCTIEEGDEVRHLPQVLVNCTHVLAVTEVAVGDRKSLVGV